MRKYTAKEKNLVENPWTHEVTDHKLMFTAAC